MKSGSQREAYIAPGRAILGVPALHPENVLWDPSLNGDCKATHAARGAREACSADTNLEEGPGEHL